MSRKFELCKQIYSAIKKTNCPSKSLRLIKRTMLSLLFLITAILYSSVGFGGGSTYLALLTIWDIPYSQLPLVALSCNVIVVLGNCINYIRAGNLRLKLLLPYLMSSIPLAFLGGSLAISKSFFEIALFISLTTAGILLFFKSRSTEQAETSYSDTPLLLSIPIGGLLGFVSGVIGIGGGIFLSPILFLLKAAPPKQIATTASLFILINSVSGIFGQFTKAHSITDLKSYWLLLIAVLIGGQIGNLLHLKLLSPQKLTMITAGLVLFVGLRMGFRLI